VTWITIDTPINYLFSTATLTADESKTISGVFVGAVSTYVALVWTKDIGDAKGLFWPSTRFYSAVGKLFKRLTPRPPNTSVEYAACYLDTVEGYGDIGWDFMARFRRAKVLANYIRQHPP
jgi:hypothetical protein